jgi:hypothetical protein
MCTKHADGAKAHMISVLTELKVEQVQYNLNKHIQCRPLMFTDIEKRGLTICYMRVHAKRSNLARNLSTRKDPFECDS